jgi:hypothetical protein
MGRSMRSKERGEKKKHLKREDDLDRRVTLGW